MRVSAPSRISVGGARPETVCELEGVKYNRPESCFSPLCGYMRLRWRFVLKGLHTNVPVVDLFPNAMRLYVPSFERGCYPFGSVVWLAWGCQLEILLQLAKFSLL